MEVYRQYVPHYPLRGEDAPVFQAFTVGDVRFVMTDARSARVPASGDEPGTMFGPDQLDWLTRELSRADRYGLVVWVQGAPWVDKPDPTSDTWAAFPEERQAIADTIARYDVDNLMMVSGDAHMLAYDDGTHTDYSRSGDAGFPLLHAASLDRKAGQKGGPYTGPVLPGGGQFGTVDVRDDGTEVQGTLTGRTWDDRVLFTKRFTVSRDD
jgi:phosphodiesterase/alkaline phosphatase D-like protein